MNLDVIAESQSGTPNLSKTIEVFDWNSGSYVEIFEQSESFNVDSVGCIDVSTGIQDFVSPTLEVDLRISWRATGFTLNFPWQVRLDQFVLNDQ